METYSTKTEFCRQVSSLLISERKQRKLSTNRVREITNIDISKIERRSANLSIFTLHRLLNLYGITMSDFFRMVETARRAVQSQNL